MKKILKISLIIFLILLLSNTISYADFYDIKFDIDKINVEEQRSTDIIPNTIGKMLGYNVIYTPYIIILIYLMVQILFLKKYKKIKSSMIINLMIIALITLVNSVMSEFFRSRMNHGVVYEVDFINIIINSVILTIGIVCQIIITKKFNDEKISRFYKIAKIIILGCVIAIISILVNGSRYPTLHVVETDWGFGVTFDKRTYDKKIIKGKRIEGFEVIDIDDEGVLVEYTRGYYEKNENSDSMLDYEYKKETVQQKMLWNVNYTAESAKDPGLDVDGGTNRYVRFEK